MLYPKGTVDTATKRMPDYEYIWKELLKNGVTRKLLWTEYLEECRQSGEISYAEENLQIGLLEQLRNTCSIALNRAIFISNKYAETIDTFQGLFVL